MIPFSDRGLYDKLFFAMWCVVGDGLLEHVVSFLHNELGSKGIDLFRSPNSAIELNFPVFSENLTLHDPGDRAGVSSFWIWIKDAGGTESEVDVG